MTVNTKRPMTAEECCLKLQWQPIMKAPYRSRKEFRHLRRIEREERQKQREEAVLFIESFLLCGLGSVAMIGLLILGALGGNF